jgi:signal transduction histidine kinase
MFRMRVPRIFRRLRGKLTLSYTLISVVTFLLLEVIVLSIVFLALTLNTNVILETDLKQQATLASPYFIHSVPDEETLTAWLRIVNGSLVNQWPLSGSSPLFFTVVDTQGQSLASIGTHPISTHNAVQAYLSSSEITELQAVLQDSRGKTSRVSQETNGTLVAITPIVSTQGKAQGALLLKATPPNKFLEFVDLLRVIGFTGVLVTIIAALAGLVFGYITARSITRRLKRLSDASERWSRGDFTALAQDNSQDELGQTAQQLNRMAEQLRNLLKARQELATLEERNRLARDLHDSVKQQIFAVGMQIGATKMLLKRDADAAEKRLDEAQKLVRQAQQELTSLIKELRPVALEGKGLVTALRELVTQWTQQTDIVANVRVEGAQPLPLIVEEALFRVAQEALSNIARHSKATLVQMDVTLTDEYVTLSIVDNGQGFDSAQQGRTGAMGVGLLSMRERMKAHAGDVSIESTPGQGTKVIAQCKRLGIATDDANTSESKGTVLI